MLKRFFSEPIVHFAALALAIFAIYGALAPSGAVREDEIVVTAPKIEQIAAVFAKTWQRPPSPPELKGLIDGYVEEEIYVREALSLGLDKDDTVIRRRLQQKMEFLNDAAVDTFAPTDADLESYLRTNTDKFAVSPQTGFQQVFFNPDQRGENIGADAEAVMKQLQADPTLKPNTLGDASLLPSEMPPTAASTINDMFGPDFAAALAAAAPGQWIGPVASSFGLHLIRVSDRKAERVPALGEVRDAVVREWTNERRKEFEEARLQALLKRYRVTIEAMPGTGPAS